MKSSAEWFSAFSRAIERWTGSPLAFIFAAAGVIVWVAFGPYFEWSDTYQLVINTLTTIITFLMVFVLQNAQTRDTFALHLKLDELIRATRDARNVLIAAEELDDAAMAAVKRQLQRLAE